MRIAMFGAPGTGKGTQAEKLVGTFSVPQISTGDLLRAAVAEGSQLGRKAKAAMDAGELVADEVVIEMIRERLAQPDAQDGFILDGFPRSIKQAESLDVMLERLEQPLEQVIHLEVEDEEIVQRLLSRGRDDDSEEVIRNRLQVFSNQTQPLINYYEDQGKLVSVDGTGDMQAIYDRIVKALDR